MLKVITFTAGVVIIAATAMAVSTATKSGQATAGAAAENCRTITVQPDAAYGINTVQTLRICN